MPLSYPWAIDQYGNWFSLYELDLTQVSGTGVYLIGYWSQEWGHVVTLDAGQGVIANRLSVHRDSRVIAEYINLGPVVATWACPPAEYLDGAERFLADRLNPLVGRIYPRALPIEINLPPDWMPG